MKKNLNLSVALSFVLVSVLVIGSLAVSAQSGVKPGDLYRAADDGSYDTMSWSLGPGDVPTLDPALATDTSSNQVIQQVFMGLTVLDEETADVLNAVATDLKKDESAADGSIKYTYTLRADIPWVRYNAETEAVEPVLDCGGNVRFLTAKDFEYAIKRVVDPALASDYAYMVTDYVKGAADYYSGGDGADPDGILVRAVDDATLEITWLAEFAGNNMIAGRPTYFAVPSWLIDGDTCTEEASDRWTTAENIQTYGPYAVKEWIHDDSLTIVLNPYWPADIAFVPPAQIEEVAFRVLDSAAALAEFESGGLTGSNVVPSSEIDRIKADPVLTEAFHSGEDLCTYYYGFNTTAPFVDDARIRRALSMAIDRQSLIDNVTKGGQVPAQWFSRPGTVAAPTLEEYPDLGVKYDPETAKELLAAYMEEKGIADPSEIKIELMHNTSENHAKIAVAIQQMWKEALGIDITISNQEWAVYVKTTRSKDTPQVFRMAWCAGYPDNATFLNDGVSSGASLNPTADGNPGSEPTGTLMWYDEKFEDLIAAALRTLDPIERTKLYAEAENILVYEDAALAPIYWYKSLQLSDPRLNRTYSILGGVENFYKWSYK